MVVLRAFRATEDPDTCHRFIDGHERVLSSIGIKKVTSAKEDWMYNPAAFVIVVEDPETKEIHGGARLHAHGGTQKLPIEEATAYMDSKVSDLIEEYAKGGTGEICGLWNSRKIAGLGFGSLYLNRATLAIAEQVGISSLFSLCAPYTMKPAYSFGYEREESVGENGQFYYPKLDLIATVMVLKDCINMPLADPLQRNRIFNLREDLNQLYIENEAHKEVEVSYNLKINNISPDEFKI